MAEDFLSADILGDLLDWFRHFSDADTSLKLSNLIDKMGMKGYGQYWALFGLLNKKFDGTNHDCIKVHEHEILGKLRVRYVGPMREVLGNMAGLELFAYSREERIYIFNCPMLLDLMSKDSKYNRKKRNASDQGAKPRIENKIKNKNNTPIVPLSEGSNLLELPEQNKIEIHSAINQSLNSDMERQNVPSEFDPKKWVVAEESKVSPKFTPDHVIQIWNENMGREFGYCRSFGCGEHLKNVLESIKELKCEEDWLELFGKCRKSKHLTGGSESGWTVNLLWLVNYDNALKVLSDVYDDSKVIRNLFAGIKDDSAEVGS